MGKTVKGKGLYRRCAIAFAPYAKDYLNVKDVENLSKYDIDCIDVLVNLYVTLFDESLDENTLMTFAQSLIDYSEEVKANVDGLVD